MSIHCIVIAISEMLKCNNFILFKADDCVDMPADSGSLLYQFLLHPDNTHIENLSVEMLQVCTGILTLEGLKN